MWGDVGVSQGCCFKEKLIIEHPQLSIDMHTPLIEGGTGMKVGISISLILFYEIALNIKRAMKNAEDVDISIRFY